MSKNEVDSGKSKVKSCSCTNPVQDRMYGQQKRLFNYRPKKKVHVCTVCGTSG